MFAFGRHGGRRLSKRPRRSLARSAAPWNGTSKSCRFLRGQFQSIASRAKAWCPVSKLMNTDMVSKPLWSRDAAAITASGTCSVPLARGDHRKPTRALSSETSAVQPKGDSVKILNIVTSPRKDQSASRALVDAFLREYAKQADDVVVDTLDVWQEWLPEFDAQTINAKYKGVSGEPMTPAEVTAWEKIRELASRFQRADRIVMGVPMWNFSFPQQAETTH
jgi:hypothetical protein